MNDKINDLVNFVDSNNKNNEIVRSKKKNIKLFIINIITIILLISSGMGIKTYLDQKEDSEEIKKINEELKKEVTDNNTQSDIKEEIENNSKEDYSTLVAQNSDMVGWLSVLGTEIDMPVVQTSNNKYYLTHDFNKEWNSMGWAFADYRNTFPELSDNTIIYGHTYKKTTIFSSLNNVLEKKWLNNDNLHFITFNTLEEDATYEIFSVYTIDVTSDYLETDIDDDFINMITKRSIKDFNIDVDRNDKILTLSTCYINSKTRLVVHAKKV